MSATGADSSYPGPAGRQSARAAQEGSELRCLSLLIVRTPPLRRPPRTLLGSPGPLPDPAGGVGPKRPRHRRVSVVVGCDVPDADTVAPRPKTELVEDVFVAPEPIQDERGEF